MANIDQLTFTNVPLDTLGVGAIPLTSYSGSLNVNYDTGVVTGNLSVAPALGISLTNYSNFTVTPGAGNTYTITGTGQTAGLAASTISIQYAGNAPTSVSTQYNVLGVELAAGTNGTVSSTAVCFASGTLIRTERGDILVEALAVGDKALTASGALRPIVWLGHRVVKCHGHREPLSVMPVRIAAHAFGDDRPSRDLFVSPGHAVCVDVVGETLIMASSLVNGTTITQDDVEEITYWHVELEDHDIIFANNLRAESYLEMGNRPFFGESGAVALLASPDAPPMATALRTHADFCRPFHHSGPLVDVVRDQLRGRAETLGWTMVEAPFAGLHLVVDGVRIEPALHGMTARFMVPAGARDVWMISTTCRPIDVGLNGDTRALGVCLAGLAIDDGFGAPVQVAIDNPLLCVGFYETENGSSRWTAGRARIPAALWEDRRESFFLRVDLTGPAPARWVTEDATRKATPTSRDHLVLVANAA